MKYAVTEDGISALKALSVRMRENAVMIRNTADALESTLEANYHALGPHGASIKSLIAEFRQSHQDACVPIWELSESILILADGYQEFVDTDRFLSGRYDGEANAGTSSGGEKSISVNNIHSISSWIKDINPKYNSPFYPIQNPYRKNCGSCAFAIESRLNGDSSAVAVSKNIGKDYEMEQITGKICRYMTVHQIESVLKERGAGSHLIVGINRKPTPSGKTQAGHWFNAFYDGNTIYVLEGQSGNIYNWPHDYVDISEWCAMV